MIEALVVYGVGFWITAVALSIGTTANTVLNTGMDKVLVSMLVCSLLWPLYATFLVVKVCMIAGTLIVDRFKK